MPIHLIFEQADGTVIKGLTECTIQSATQKQMVDSDLNHGVIRPNGESAPQIITVRTFSWANNGDPLYPITDAGLFITNYYTLDATYNADPGKSFCGGGSSATFGDYNASGGSHSAVDDLATILGWGNAETGGVKISVDLSSTYTTFKTGYGDGPGNTIPLAASCMDIGTTDGQLEPGDRATLYMKIAVPADFNDANDAGVYLFALGLYYNYTE